MMSELPLKLMARRLSSSDVAVIAADLMSDDGENPEYDRACVEIVRDAAGLDWEDDTRQELHDYLRWLKGRHA